MKKLFGYVIIPALLSLQACNSNTTADANAATDSVTSGSVTSDSTAMQGPDSTSTDTSTNKKAMKVDASDVPTAVVTAFNSKYPNADKVKWMEADKSEKTLYRARFETNGKKMMAAFAEDGSFVKEKELDK